MHTKLCYFYLGQKHARHQTAFLICQELRYPEPSVAKALMKSSEYKALPIHLPFRWEHLATLAQLEYGQFHMSYRTFILSFITKKEFEIQSCCWFLGQAIIKTN